MLSDEEIEKLLKAGDIAKRAFSIAEKIAKPGARLLDVAERIERYIMELGGEPAFPVNIGVNHIAAHYTPTPSDSSVIPDNSIVKIDLGVHVDGYIADSAITLYYNPIYEPLVEASRRALEKAIEVVKPGVRVSEIGRVIEETIKTHGFKPIKNLSGHGLERYTIHSGVVIPNYHDRLNLYRVREGVYALEPFATSGAGLVVEGSLVTIYALKPTSRALPGSTRTLYERIYGSRKTLPFTPRWFIKNPIDEEAVARGLMELRNLKLLLEYPVLIEKEKAPVSQFEHTVVVTSREVLVTTM